MKYDYECSKGHRFEVEQSMNDKALDKCLECKSKARRVIHAPAFILKGGGWYKDSYSKDKGSKDGKSG